MQGSNIHTQERVNKIRSFHIESGLRLKVTSFSGKTISNTIRFSRDVAPLNAFKSSREGSNAFPDGIRIIRSSHRTLNHGDSRRETRFHNQTTRLTIKRNQPLTITLSSASRTWHRSSFIAKPKQNLPVWSQHHHNPLRDQSRSQVHHNIEKRNPSEEEAKCMGIPKVYESHQPVNSLISLCKKEMSKLGF